MTINTSNIESLLRPDLDLIFGQYNQLDEQWREIFSVRKSDKQYELVTEMRYMHQAAYTAEGAPANFQDMGQQSVTRFYHRKYTTGFVITREAIEDCLYKDQFPDQAYALRNAFRIAKEYQAASVLNNAFNAAYPLADGQPLCSTAHVISGGTVSNKLPIPVQLSEAALESMLIGIQTFRDAAGNLIHIRPEKLVVPRELQFTAERLLESKYRTGTGNNDINAIYNLKSFPKGYVVNQYLTSPTAYFALTDDVRLRILYERSPLRVEMRPDPTTSTIVVVGFERYSVGIPDFRAIYGTEGA